MARDPRDLYQLSPGALAPDGDIVMLHFLEGFIDAGAAGRLASAHLSATLPHSEIVSFDVDMLIDYRARRPVMTFAKDHWEHYDTPGLVLSRLRDPAGTPFLLLSGPEPDREWHAFIAAVRQLCADLRVRLAVGFHGIPMAVPHTRPLGVTAHATRSALVEGYRPLVDRLQVPGSADALLELRLGEEGRDAVGFAVHVPHYLAQTAYPAAAVTLLECVERATGLRLPSDALREAARRTELEIARQVEGSDEVTEVVRSLEEQYDAFARGEGLQAGESDAMPTAEELGAQFEQFLAEQEGRGDPPDPTVP